MILRSILVLTFIFGLSFTCISQDTDSSIDIVGQWKVHEMIPDLEKYQMLFGQSTLTINKDSTFAMTIGNEMASDTNEGSWTTNNGMVLLNSDSLPGPIQLEDITSDNCTWNAKELNCKIVFSRKK